MESSSIIAQKSTCGLSCVAIMVMMVMKYADNARPRTRRVTSMLEVFFFIIIIIFLDFLSLSPLEESSHFQDSEQNAERLQQERGVFCIETLTVAHVAFK